MEMERIKARYRKLVFFTWFLTLDLIMFGAFVRLTDSGYAFSHVKRGDTTDVMLDYVGYKLDDLRAAYRGRSPP